MTIELTDEELEIIRLWYLTAAGESASGMYCLIPKESK